jgi:hypothetical protein
VEAALTDSNTELFKLTRHDAKSTRAVERGSRLVAVIPWSCEAILQVHAVI